MTSYISPGVETVTIGTSGTYDITADGAQGGGSTPRDPNTGGGGAGISGDVYLAAGTKLEIVVGGEGDNSQYGGGGGGGSFVIEVNGSSIADDTILEVAGGGGGAGNGQYEPGGGALPPPTGGNGGGLFGGDGGARGAPGQGGANGGGGGGFTGGTGAVAGFSGQSGAVTGVTFGGGAGAYGAGGGGVGGGGGGGGYAGGGGGGGGYGGGGGGGVAGGAGGGGGSYADFALLTGVSQQANSNVGDGSVTITEIVCYAAGTRILTAHGEVAVERLALGDLLVTASGAHRPVRWLGSRRVNCARHPEPSAVWPVRIQAGAFAGGLPTRDLSVSPGHSIFVDGVLIQAEKLVNDASITQVPVASVEYWHVELDSHDILIAEGLGAESYLDTGNRAGFFNNGGAYVEAHPDFRPKHWAETCVPLVLDGAILEGVKARLLARAQSLGYRLTSDSDVHLMVAGQRIEPLLCNEQRATFLIPPGRSQIELRCREFIPTHIDATSTDQRRLGVCVSRLQLDGDDLPLDDAAAFERGWHEFEAQSPEHQYRWSRESAPLPDGTRWVLIEFARRSFCWSQPDSLPGMDRAPLRWA